MANNIHDIDGKEDYQTKLADSADKYVLVDFWADWCGPCKAAEPVIHDLAEKLEEQLTVLKVNVDENRDLAQAYSVMSIPTMFLYRPNLEEGEESNHDEAQYNEDEEVDRKFTASRGFRPKPAMLDWFDSVGIDIEAATESDDK